MGFADHGGELAGEGSAGQARFVRQRLDGPGGGGVVVHRGQCGGDGRITQRRSPSDGIGLRLVLYPRAQDVEQQGVDQRRDDAVRADARVVQLRAQQLDRRGQFRMAAVASGQVDHLGELLEQRVRALAVEVVVAAQQAGGGTVATDAQGADRRVPGVLLGAWDLGRGIGMVGEDVAGAVTHEDHVTGAHGDRLGAGLGRIDPAAAVQHDMESRARGGRQPQRPGRAAVGAHRMRRTGPHRSQCLAEDVHPALLRLRIPVVQPGPDRHYSMVSTTLPTV